MTPGCTAESCNLGENYSLLQEKGFIVLGVVLIHQRVIKSLLTSIIFLLA